MDIFFDTEFTTLPNSLIGYPGLISVGCVTADGRCSYYAELTNTWQPGNCSEFVLNNVLPLLDGGKYQMTDAQCAASLKEWIEGLTEEEVILRSDNPAIDWPWIESLFQFFGCWPNNLRRKCGTIIFDDEVLQQRYIDALDEFWKVPVHAPLRHHALVDAESLMFAWWHATANEMPEDKFRELVSSLMQSALNDGDNGYRYWSGVVENLRKFRA